MKVLAQKVSADLHHPQDKRRFGHLIDVNFFKSAPIQSNRGDKFIFNIHSNISVIRELQKQGAYIIFDYCDMIHVRNSLSFLFMTILWWIKGKIRVPVTKGQFKKQLSSVDVLVVGSSAQKDICSEFRSKRIDIIEDYFPEILNQQSSLTNVARRGVMWEGLAGGNFGILYECFRIAKKSGQELSIITDEKYPLLSGLLNISTPRILRLLASLSSNQNYRFYKWDKKNLTDNAAKNEFMLIPLNSNDKLQFYKPCNKAVLALKMGLKPVLYRTPDYEMLSKVICVEGSICFNNQGEVNGLISNYPKYDISSLNEYLTTRNKENLKLKWKATLS